MGPKTWPISLSHFLVIFLDKKSPKRRGQRYRYAEDQDDGEETEARDCGSSWTWLAPSSVKKKAWAILLHSLLASVLSGATLHQLTPSLVEASFSTGPHWAVVVFGWFSVLQSLYTLLVSTPVEVSIYRAFQSNDLSAASRAIHALNVLAVSACAQHIMWAEAIVQTCYVFLTLMPLIWMTGI